MQEATNKAPLKSGPYRAIIGMLVGALLVLMSLAPAVPNLAGATLQERSMQAVPS